MAQNVFVPKQIRLDPVPFDKDNFARWDMLFRKRCDRYGFLDILTGTRPNARAVPVRPAQPPADATASQMEAAEIAYNIYLSDLYDHDKYVFDLAQLTDLFFDSMGDSGMTELELKHAKYDDVLACYEIIKAASTVLIDQEVSTLTAQFVDLPWKPSETFKEFRVKFNNIATKLESCKIEVPDAIIRNNLLRIVKQRFPAY
jgi:hypothetical protein